MGTFTTPIGVHDKPPAPGNQALSETTRINFQQDG